MACSKFIPIFSLAISWITPSTERGQLPGCQQLPVSNHRHTVTYSTLRNILRHICCAHVHNKTEQHWGGETQICSGVNQFCFNSSTWFLLISATQYPLQEIYDITHTHIHVNQILHAIHNITHIRQGSGNPAVIRCELSLSQASLTNSFVYW